MTEPRPILTGNAAAALFRPGTPYGQWQNGIAGHRYASDAEVRAEFGCTRDTWMKAWRELKPGEWQVWLKQHSRAATSIEPEKREAYDPQRALTTRQPGGWTGYGMQQPAIGGKG